MLFLIKYILIYIYIYIERERERERKLKIEPYGVSLWKHNQNECMRFSEPSSLRWVVFLVLAFGLIHG